ncbi:MAG: T9SS type A sorting domain-containing protein [Bacteroidetes bacterium]|nr:T9SS type A sorting domain-containing protein [Bacteroidota bacterium]
MISIKRLTVILLFYSFISGSMAQTTLDTAVDINVKDVHGIVYNLFPILDSNKYVLLDFFTTTCGPCVTYAPEIEQAYVHFGSNLQDVFFLGINYGDDNPGVLEFDSLYGITFPTISGINGHGNTVALQYYFIQGFPTMVLIAPNRLILNKQIYPPGYQNLDSTISAALGISTGFGDKPDGRLGFQVSVSPNPAGAESSITLALEEPATIGYQVISPTGAVLLEKEGALYPAGRHSLRLSISTLLPGIYFVRIVNTKGQMAFVKVVKI